MSHSETIAQRVEQLEEPEHEGESVCGSCGDYHLNPNVNASITVCPDCITEHLEDVGLARAE